ncbi:MAG TPA: hypothetical protein VIG44_04675 [Thermomicrobiales bacterium]|jgi:hypothetical protein
MTRKEIIALIVWNQRLAGAACNRERVAAAYDRALAHPLVIA